MKRLPKIKPSHANRLIINPGSDQNAVQYCLQNRFVWSVIDEGRWPRNSERELEELASRQENSCYVPVVAVWFEFSFNRPPPLYSAGILLQWQADISTTSTCNCLTIFKIIHIVCLALPSITQNGIKFVKYRKLSFITYLCSCLLESRGTVPSRCSRLYS